jgi:hypothetical protein
MLLEVGVGYLSHSFAVGERTWEEEKSLDVLDFEENLLESVGEFSAYSPTDNAAIIQCKCIGNAYSQPVCFFNISTVHIPPVRFFTLQNYNITSSNTSLRKLTRE